MTNVFDFNTAMRVDQLEAVRRRTTVDVEDIRSRIHAEARSFVEWLFSGRALCTAREARIGDVYGGAGASLSIALTGPDAGLWHDHATGEGGDLIALYQAYMGYEGGRNFQLALKEIASEFLNDPVTVERSAWVPTAAQRIAEKKQKLGDKPRDVHLELGPPTASWKYFDTHGNVVASVERYEPDGTAASKTYRPYCFKTIDGAQKWVMGAPTLRPLYNLPEVALSNTVVLVEGEKCAEALNKIGIVATTAMQGAEAPVEKTDWSPLHGKTVIIWPDNDEPGFSYGRKVADRLNAIGCTVRLVNVPQDKPAKWDAADCVAERSDDARELISTAISYAAAPKPRIKLLGLDEMELMAPPSWLVEGCITQGGLSVLWGRSGDLKSFAAVDIAMCVATGHPWHGKTVKQGLVIYVAAEGAHGLARRALGWARTRGKDYTSPAFKLVPHSVALTSDDLDALVEAILGLGEKPALIIVDTLARTFGAGDENKQADMNAYVTAADRLREATSANVMIIHHSGVHEDKRERGSNVLRGAADTVIKVSRKGDNLDLINRAPEGKQKDAEEFETIKLRTQKVTYEHHDTEQSTLILMPCDEAGEAAEAADPKLSKLAQTIISILENASRQLSLVSITAATNSDKTSVRRSLQTLVEKDILVLNDDGHTKLWGLK